MPNFTKYIYFNFLLSSLVILPCIFSLLMYGLKPAIDFTGGSLLEIKIDTQNLPTETAISETISDLVTNPTIQKTTDSLIIRTQPIDQSTNQHLQSAISEKFGPVTQIRFETIGPTLGAELLKKTLIGVILAIFVILSYIAYQFKSLKYGVCAIIAMLHDTLIVIGAFSLLGHFYGIQVDTLFVTAILTVLSFSIHDTIVVYDRIRETSHRHPHINFNQIVNTSIAATLGRSINNSMTIIFMLMALFLLGGETTKWFVFALLIGTITGTYSSTFTAVPLLLVWEQKFSKR